MCVIIAYGKDVVKVSLEQKTTRKRKGRGECETKRPPLRILRVKNQNVINEIPNRNSHSFAYPSAFDPAFTRSIKFSENSNAYHPMLVKPLGSSIDVRLEQSRNAPHRLPLQKITFCIFHRNRAGGTTRQHRTPISRLNKRTRSQEAAPKERISCTDSVQIFRRGAATDPEDILLDLFGGEAASPSRC